MGSVRGIDKASVAELSLQQISKLTCDELVQIIRSVRVCFDANDSLESCDRMTLEKMVYMARRCCRNQGY